jgi:hypothetical protein
MSVAALIKRGLPDAQDERFMAAFRVTEPSGEPTMRFPQVVPAVVKPAEKVSAPPESIEVLVPPSSLDFKSATFRFPALPAEIALYEFEDESHQRLDVAAELTAIEDVRHDVAAVETPEVTLALLRTVVSAEGLKAMTLAVKVRPQRKAG